MSFIIAHSQYLYHFFILFWMDAFFTSVYHGISFPYRERLLMYYFGDLQPELAIST